MKETLSVNSADTEDRLGWYRDQLGWPCRPHRGHSPPPGGRAPGRGPDHDPDYGADHAQVDLVLGGARRFGALDLPALLGAAALERIGRRPAAAGPVLDGTGRLVFLVDLGENSVLDEEPVEFWRGTGIELRLRAEGGLPLPEAGRSGPQAVVWAVPPDPEPTALPPAGLLLGFLDRAVRDAYPALWEVARHSSPGDY
jgi:hypothetical protein